MLGFRDEVWWSRLARPALHAWSPGGPVRLDEVQAGKDDSDPRALACYGVLRADTGGMMIRFVTGRPVSGVTEGSLAWVCHELAAEGKKALLLVRDNASWHVSRRVRAWIEAHDRRAKIEGGVRIVACWLPIGAPWLNRTEARWVHGKRAIIEPERKSSGSEVIDRVSEYYQCEKLDRLKQDVP